MTRDPLAHAGRTIREARERAGISQMELARRIATMPPNIRLIERAEVMTTKKFARLIAALGLELKIEPKTRGNTYGAGLQLARKAVGLTTGDLARAVGVTPGVVQAWESDVELPDEATRKKIGETIATWLPPPPPPPPATYAAPVPAGHRDGQAVAMDLVESYRVTGVPPSERAEGDPIFSCDECGEADFEAVDESHYRCRGCGAEYEME